MNASRNTTVLGILTILGALVGIGRAVFDGDPATLPDFPTAITAITAGVGLILAKDAGKSGPTKVL